MPDDRLSVTVRAECGGRVSTGPQMYEVGCITDIKRPLWSFYKVCQLIYTMSAEVRVGLKTRKRKRTK